MMQSMKIHNLKLNYEFCDAVFNGEKTFEIRNNDRGYQKGDRIRFTPVVDGWKEKDHPITKKEYEISYLLNGWGLDTGYVALAIKEVSE